MIESSQCDRFIENRVIKRDRVIVISKRELSKSDRVIETCSVIEM